MKKQFFYAAFALAMMASCTSEETPLVDQPTTPEDDRVAIELGVDAPSITASGRSLSRGTGSVGGEGVTGDENKWNSERLYIAMVDKNGDLATEKETLESEATNILDWTNYEYRAPKEGSLADIRIYKSYDATSNSGTLQHKYYPPQGTFDFYGWHIDALPIATTATETGKVQVTVEDGTATVNEIKIDGTQDVMGARTIPFTEANTVKYNNKWTTDLNDWAFSARTARNQIKPILKFEHQLARLKFYVRAGSEKTAVNGASGANVAKDNSGKSTAMFVTALSVRDLANIIDMNLNDNGKIKTSLCDAAEATDFELGSKINGIVTPGTLTAVAPQYKYDKNNDDTHGELIGESMMFFPCSIDALDRDNNDAPYTSNSAEQIKIDLALKQYVIDTEKEEWNDQDEYTPTYVYKDKTQNATVTVKASSIVGGTGTKKFEAGNSYNIYITIYGFERIEVTAELTAWADGGDVDVDIEEGESKDPVTPAKKTFTFNVTGNTTAATISINDEPIQGTTYEAKVGDTFTWSVTDGTTTKTGEVTVGAESVTTIDVDLTPTTPAPTTFDVFFTLPQGVTTATITVTEPEDVEVTYEEDMSKYKATVPAGTTTIKYSVSGVAGYQDQTDATATVSAELANVTVELTPAVTEKTFTVKAVAGSQDVVGTIDLRYNDAEGNDIDPNQENGNEYTLPVGTVIFWTVTPQDGEAKTGTYTVTAETGTVVELQVGE